MRNEEFLALRAKGEMKNVKDIEKSLLDEDNDQLQEWLNTLILVWQSLAATDEFYLAGVSSRLRDAEYKAVDLWKEAVTNGTEA